MANFAGSRESGEYLQVALPTKEMLPKHNPYQGQISKEEAERRLKKRGGHCYLTRYSENKTSYILSVYKEQRSLKPIIQHFKITIIKSSGKLHIEGTDIYFNKIQELLNYYEKNPITPALSSIGHAYSQEKCTIL